MAAALGPKFSSVPPLLALGASLARRGFMAGLSLLVAVATTLGFVVLGIVLSRGGKTAPLHDVPILASQALAWGGGFLLAFSASARALRRDRTDGIRALIMARTGGHGALTGYLLARVFGLATLLGIVVVGGTLLAGLITSLLGVRSGLGARTLQATFASCVFGVAFALVMAPVALAALGSRSRIGGYLFLLLVVIFPSALAQILVQPLGANVAELLSIPSALTALHTGFQPGKVDVLRVLRAGLALLFFSALATGLVRKDALALEGTPEP